MERMTERDCSGWRGVLAMDAIGRADEKEARELAEHLEECGQCRTDAEEVRTAAGALSLLDAAQVADLERGSTVVGLAAGSEPVLPGLGGGPEPVAEIRPIDRRGRRPAEGKKKWVTAAACVAAVAAAVAVVAAVALGGSSTPPTRTVALSGEPGVTASVVLTSQAWGTRAVLTESGQAAGQALTVSMRTASGRWWVAGSYRTTGRSGSLEVSLSSAVPANQITDVWVSDQGGHTVLNGYVN